MKRTRSGKGEARGTRNGVPTFSDPSRPQDVYQVRCSQPSDVAYVPRMEQLLEEARRSGFVVANRSADFLERGVRERRVVFALRGALVVGFGLAHPWQEQRFVSHAPLVVAPAFRGRGLSRRIKQTLIDLCRRRWPRATMMSLTLSSVVERLNKSLGFEAVPYCDMAADPGFWEGCRGCRHYAHLKRNQLQDCHCWAGLLLPPGEVRERVIPKDALRRPDTLDFSSPSRNGDGRH